MNENSNSKMRPNELIRRYILFVISLFFSGLGVAVTKRGALGVSPISSVANVMSYLVPAVSFGTWLFLWNCLLLLAQILILRRRFQLVQLLQIPLSVLFGWFTDLGVLIAEYLPASYYPLRLLWVVAGVVILAFGISLSVIANVIMNSGEAFVKVISDALKKPFGNVKICFDISCVLSAVVLSLLAFHGQLVGTREGTFLAAVLTGMVVKLFLKLLKEPVERMLQKEKN